jgi:type IV fimbrial biogenesis protein FimT
MFSGSHSKATQGFTLIDILIAFSLVLLVFSYGVPGVSNFIKNSRVTSLTNRLATDINYARSEAVNHAKTVIICRSDDANTTSPTCSGTTNNWTTGWLIFVDRNDNSSFDDSNDLLLRATRGALGSISVKSNDTANTILRFKADGAIETLGNKAAFTICDDRGEGYGNQLQISPSGRPRLITPVPETCDNPST